MRDSFPIGRIFGIQIRVHFLFPLILGFVLLQASSEADTSWPDAAFLSAMVLMLFGVVLLHELGHSLVAQAFGIQVLDITFWPLGGMARMSEIPESPRVEGQVAIAGPLVNLALAALGLLLLVLLGGWGEGMGTSIAHIMESPTAFLTAFVAMNLMLGIFNLVPAFPMDGGRILRAYLARNREWVRATELAVHIGRFFAFAMMLAGSYSCILALIGVWVWWMGARELWYVRMKHKARTAYEETGYPGSQTGGATEGFSLDDLHKLEAFRGTMKKYREHDDT